MKTWEREEVLNLRDKACIIALLAPPLLLSVLTLFEALDSDPNSFPSIAAASLSIMPLHELLHYAAVRLLGYRAYFKVKRFYFTLIPLGEIKTFKMCIILLAPQLISLALLIAGWKWLLLLHIAASAADLYGAIDYNVRKIEKIRIIVEGEELKVYVLKP